MASTKKLYSDLIDEAVNKRAANLIALPEFTIIPYFPGTRDRNGM